MDTDLWLWEQLCFWRPAFFCQQNRTFFTARTSLSIKKNKRKMRISHFCLLRTFVGCVVWEAASVAAAFAANIGTTFKWELCNCIFAQFVRICHPLSFEFGCQEQHQGQKEKGAIFPFSSVLHFDLMIYALIQNPKQNISFCQDLEWHYHARICQKTYFFVSETETSTTVCLTWLKVLYSWDDANWRNKHEFEA